MNTRLLALLDWAESAGVSLDMTDVTLGSEVEDWKTGRKTTFTRLTFYHRKEKRANVVALKRAVDLVENGQPPYVDLRAKTKLSDGTELRIVYEGAFTCEVSHECKPTGWAAEQLDEHDEVVLESMTGESTDDEVIDSLAARH